MAASELFAVPDAWRWATLGEICHDGGGTIQTGPFGSQLHASDYSDEGTPVVMPQDLLDSRVSEAAVARVSSDHVQRLARHKLAVGDIVYSRRGDVSRKALIGDREAGWLCGTGCLLVRPGENVSGDFIARALTHPATVSWISRHAVGATMPNLNTEILSAVPIVIPPPDEQRRIASVLGALDDKIESNRRLCRALLDVAAEAYRYAVRSSFSAVIGDLGTVRGGGTPKSSVDEFWAPAEVPWVTPKDMTLLAGSPVVWGGERSISKLGLEKSSAKLLPAGTVLYTSRATLGMVAIAQQPLSTNQGFIAVEPAAGLSSVLVYFTLCACRDAIAAKANGSTFLEVNKTNFKSVGCRIPQPATQKQFEGVAEPIIRQVSALERETATLTAVRDALLPKLVSGQIRVQSDGDVSVEDLAA